MFTVGSLKQHLLATNLKFSAVFWAINRLFIAQLTHCSCFMGISGEKNKLYNLGYNAYQIVTFPRNGKTVMGLIACSHSTPANWGFREVALPCYTTL